ncbi:MAG: M48 family metallopeptidase [Candidatus Scalindua sp.]|nr:M48 family metallopeptidase [Candidatus Scalindua sp.]
MNLVKTGKRVERRSLDFGNTKIAFSLSFSTRKNLNISVHPNLEVTVNAPVDRSLDDVLSRVKKRAPWIIKQKNYFERFQPLPTEKEYVSGETHYYLGRQYRLKVVKSDKDDVKLIGRYFTIYTADRSNKKMVKELLNTWYINHAEEVFNKRFKICYDSVKRYHIPHPQLRLRRMTKRWGSCTNSKTILINTELIKTPICCIDYIIMHELCHLKIRKHDKNFYSLLTKFMPDWEKRKESIESKSMI